MFSVTVCKISFCLLEIQKCCMMVTHITKLCYLCDSELSRHFVINKWVKRLVLLLP